MRVVVHDQETYEPLTVIEVPIRFMREIEEGRRDRRLRFPAHPPLSVTIDPPITPLSAHAGYVVDLKFEPIYRGSSYRDGERPFMWVCSTDDPETALLLRAVFLPGQNREVQRREEAAFLGGLMRAFNV